MTKKTFAIIGLVASLFAAGGCNIVMRRTLDNPAHNQVIRVESGERLFFELEENGTTGYQWYAKSDDPDVGVKVDHIAGDRDGGHCGAPGKAKVEIRIHRGYDGPSAVTFRYKRAWEKKPIEQFTLTFYKRTGDVAVWE